MAERTLLRLTGGLLVGGLLVTLIVTHEHPAGDDDNYPVIFAKYVNSNDWVAVHLNASLLVRLTASWKRDHGRREGNRDRPSWLSRDRSQLSFRTGGRLQPAQGPR